MFVKAFHTRGVMYFYIPERYLQRYLLNLIHRNESFHNFYSPSVIWLPQLQLLVTDQEATSLVQCFSQRLCNIDSCVTVRLVGRLGLKARLSAQWDLNWQHSELGDVPLSHFFSTTRIWRLKVLAESLKFYLCCLCGKSF